MKNEIMERFLIWTIIWVAKDLHSSWKVILSEVKTGMMLILNLLSHILEHGSKEQPHASGALEEIYRGIINRKIKKIRCIIL